MESPRRTERFSLVLTRREKELAMLIAAEDGVSVAAVLRHMIRAEAHRRRLLQPAPFAQVLQTAQEAQP